MARRIEVGKTYCPTETYDNLGGLIEFTGEDDIFKVTDVDDYGQVYTHDALFNGRSPVDTQGWCVCNVNDLIRGDITEVPHVYTV